LPPVRPCRQRNFDALLSAAVIYFIHALVFHKMHQIMYHLMQIEQEETPVRIKEKRHLI
jgi:hypothetical protein